VSTTSSDPLVSIKLSEIKRLLDALATARDDNPRNRQLWVQWAGIYQRLCKQANVPAGQPRNAGPYPDPAKAGV
jgi:hypothetical protein